MQLFHPTKSAVIQIAKTVQAQIKFGLKAGCEIRRAGSWLGRLPFSRKRNGVAGTSPGVPGDILGSYEELRWMEPHMSSPSPCVKLKTENHENSNQTKVHRSNG
jgi:hypothetical protein